MQRQITSTDTLLKLHFTNIHVLTSHNYMSLQGITSRPNENYVKPIANNISGYARKNNYIPGVPFDT